MKVGHVEDTNMEDSIKEVKEVESLQRRVK